MFKKPSYERAVSQVTGWAEQGCCGCKESGTPTISEFSLVTAFSLSSMRCRDSISSSFLLARHLFLSRRGLHCFSVSRTRFNWEDTSYSFLEGHFVTFFRTLRQSMALKEVLPRFCFWKCSEEESHTCFPRLFQPSYPARLSTSPSCSHPPCPGPPWLEETHTQSLRSTIRARIQAWLSLKPDLAIRDLAKSPDSH